MASNAFSTYVEYVGSTNGTCTIIKIRNSDGIVQWSKRYSVGPFIKGLEVTSDD